MDKHTKISLILSYVLIVSLGAYVGYQKHTGKLGSTILTTELTDTFGTFRTNVNTSLTNLENDKIEAGDSITGLTFGQATTTTLYFGGSLFTSFTGRSLSLNSGTLDVDSELYTYGVAANIFATSSDDGIATTTEDFLSIRVPVASTITSFNCYADTTGTSTIKASIASSPLSAGTNILYSTGTRCGAQEVIATTTFSTTAISAGQYLRIYVSDASPTGSRPDRIYANFTLTKDD